MSAGNQTLFSRGRLGMALLLSLGAHGALMHWLTLPASLASGGGVGPALELRLTESGPDVDNPVQTSGGERPSSPPPPEDPRPQPSVAAARPPSPPRAKAAPKAVQPEAAAPASMDSLDRPAADKVKPSPAASPEDAVAATMPVTHKPRPAQADEPQARVQETTTTETPHPQPDSGKEPRQAESGFAQSPRSEPGQQADKQTPRGSQAKVRAQLPRLRLQLQQAWQAHFRYPLRARRRGWEGEVILGVDLARDGRVTGVRLVASSGYATLDRAALSSMRSVNGLRQPLPEPLSLRVPVAYRLLN